MGDDMEQVTVLPSTSDEASSSKEIPNSTEPLLTQTRVTRSKDAAPRKPMKLDEATSLVWTDVEKLNLLESLVRYGVESRKTYTCLSHKTEDQIKNFLRTRQRISRTKKQIRINEATKKKCRSQEWETNKDIVTPLEEWIQYFFRKFMDERSSSEVSPQLMMALLPATFLILSLFEAHPDPRDCAGINYKDVYEFLFTVSRGNPTKMLPKATANFLFTAFYDASKFYKLASLANESMYLNAINSSPGVSPESVVEQPVKIKTYPGKRKHVATQNKEEKLKKIPEFVSKLMKTQGINPFQISMDFLEVPFENSKIKKTQSRQKLTAREQIAGNKKKFDEPF